MQVAKNIFLIDDDFDDRFLLREAFVSTGFDVQITETSNGIEALEVIRTMQILPSLIIVDMNMPGMDGINTIKNIRLVAPKVPVVLLTTSLTPSLANQAMSLGADECFNKPVTFQELCSIANQLCQQFLQK